MNIHVKVLQLHAGIELYGKDLEFSHRATDLQLLRNICWRLQLKSKTKMRICAIVKSVCQEKISRV